MKYKVFKGSDRAWKYGIMRDGVVICARVLEYCDAIRIVDALNGTPEPEVQFSESDQALIDLIKERYGLTTTIAVIRMALRELARRIEQERQR